MSSNDRDMILEKLKRLGGITRTNLLLEARCTHYEINREIQRGSIVRPRKGWIAFPNIDPTLMRAARHGWIVTCITQARRLGLWVPEGMQRSPAHFSVRSPGGSHSRSGHDGVRRSENVCLHWARPIRPRSPDQLEDRLEDVLNLVAHCLPREDALAVWESALHQRKVDLPSLQRLHFPGVAKHILAAASPFSDSGLESMVRDRLRWLRIPVRAQAWILGHRTDFLLGQRLVLQIDGAAHTGNQRTSDISHDAELTLRGYHVIRVGYRQVVFEWPSVQDVIMQAVAQGLHAGP